MELTNEQRETFDMLLEEAIGALPPGLAKLLDEIAVIVEDYPAPDVLEEFRNEDGTLPDRDELCGLHSGVAFTERHLDAVGELPSDIHLYREGIIATVGGWDQEEAEDWVYEEIMVTLLHEIGHQFGLDEDDLKRLGYE